MYRRKSYEVFLKCAWFECCKVYTWHTISNVQITAFGFRNVGVELGFYKLLGQIIKSNARFLLVIQNQML